MDGNQTAGQSMTLVWAEISQQLSNGIAMEYYADVHGPQRMNPNNFSDALTCHHEADICGFK